jgi:hypothetical protein
MPEIVLSATDRELCSFAATLLMGLLDGPRRERATERICQRYREDFAAAHPAADPAVIDEAMTTFRAALLREMEAVGLADTAEAEMARA